MANDMKINTYVFDAMVGDVGGYGYVTEDLSRPGTDGHLLRRIGKRGQVFHLVTKSFHETISVAKRRVAEYERLQGYFVTLEKNDRVYKKIHVLAVRNEEIQELGAATSGDDYLITTNWTMQRTGE